MILKMFTDSLLSELKTNIKVNISKYSESTAFVRNLIENYDVGLYNLDMNVDYPELDKTIASKENQLRQWEIDFNNAVKLHKDFVLKYNISLGILSDERFVSFLAHDVYYEYMVARWPYNGKERRILEKFFFANSSQSFTRNTLLRFFWYTYITYLPESEDPYVLTKVAFEHQDVVNQIMERKYSRNKKIVLAALTAIKNTNNKIPNEKRTLLGKSLNNILSLYALDVFKDEDLIKLCEEEIKSITMSGLKDEGTIEEE